MIQSIFIPEISTLGTHSTWTPGAQGTAGTKDTISKPRLLLQVLQIYFPTLETEHTRMLKIYQDDLFSYLLSCLFFTWFKVLCTEESEETTSFLYLIPILRKILKAFGGGSDEKICKMRLSCKKDESGKKSTSLEYYWRPPFIREPHRRLV